MHANPVAQSLSLMQASRLHAPRKQWSQDEQSASTAHAVDPPPSSEVMTTGDCEQTVVVGRPSAFEMGPIVHSFTLSPASPLAPPADAPSLEAPPREIPWFPICEFSALPPQAHAVDAEARTSTQREKSPMSRPRALLVPV